MRRDNSSLDSTNHELEKTVSQLRMRVAVLEQELQDKEQVQYVWVWVWVWVWYYVQYCPRLQANSSLLYM